MPELKLHYFEVGKLMNRKGFAISDWAVTAQTSGLDSELRKLAYKAANIGNINADRPFPGQFGFFRIHRSEFFVASYQRLSDKKETGRKRIHQGRYVIVSDRELRQLNGFLLPVFEELEEEIPLRTSRAFDLPLLEIDVPSKIWIEPVPRLEASKLESLLPRLLNNKKLYLRNVPSDRFSRLALIEQVRSIVPYSCRVHFTFTTSVVFPTQCQAQIQIVDENTKGATNAINVFGKEPVESEAAGQAYSSWIIRKSKTQPRDLPSILDQIERIQRKAELPAANALDRFAYAREIWDALRENDLKNSLTPEDIHLALRECPRYLDGTELHQLLSMATDKLTPSEKLFQLVFTAFLVIGPREDSDRLISEVIERILFKCLHSYPKEHLVVSLVTTFASGFLDNQRRFVKTSISRNIRTIFEILIARDENLAVMTLSSMLQDPKLKSYSARWLVRDAGSCFRKATPRIQFRVVCVIAQELGLRELNQLIEANDGLAWVIHDQPQVFSAIAQIYSDSREEEVFQVQLMSEGYHIHTFTWTKLLIIGALNQQKPYLITSEMIRNVYSFSALDPRLHSEIMDAALRNTREISGFSPEVARILFDIACSTENIGYLKFAALLLKYLIEEIPVLDFQELLTVYFERVFSHVETIDLRQFLDRNSVLSIVSTATSNNAILNAAIRTASKGSLDSKNGEAKLKELRKAKYDFEYKALKEALDGAI